MQVLWQLTAALLKGTTLNIVQAMIIWPATMWKQGVGLRVTSGDAKCPKNSSYRDVAGINMRRGQHCCIPWWSWCSQLMQH